MRGVDGFLGFALHLCRGGPCRWFQKKKVLREFEEEIRVLTKLRHPNIVTVVGVFKSSERSW